MTAKCFVDTNILVYGFDDSDPVKQDRAQWVMRRLWESRCGRISQQVLQEFYVATTRKLKPSLPLEKARQEVKELLSWKPVSPSPELFIRAWEIEDRWHLSWWDSLIVAAAHHSECTILFSEDLQDGLDLDGLCVRNPFADTFDSGILL